MKKKLLCTLIFASASLYSMEPEAHTDTDYEPSQARIVRDLSKLENRIVHYHLTDANDLVKIIENNDKIRAIRNHEVPIIKTTYDKRKMYFYLSPTGTCWSFGQLVDNEDIPLYIREMSLTPNTMTTIAVPDTEELFYVINDIGNLACKDNEQLYVFKHFVSKCKPQH